MTKPIRVLNVVGRMDAGGIETFVMNLYREIDRDLVQFDFLAHYGNADAFYNREILALGGRIFEMPPIKTTATTRYWMLPQYALALRAFFMEHPEYRVVHGHMTNTAAIYFPIARSYGNARCLIAHSHLSKARPGLAGVLTDLLQRSVPSRATELFACSRPAAGWLFGEAIASSGEWKMIPNGIKMDSFRFDQKTRDEYRANMGLGRRLVVGHVGRFYEEKNHAHLLRTFAQILQLRADAVLLLIGDGPLRRDLETYARSLGLAESVRFLGASREVPKIMQAMDVFVLPSLYEGLPVSAIEAQASGLPCVLSSGVPKETDITGNVHFLALEERATRWAKVIVDAAVSHHRLDTSPAIRAAGYDIVAVAAELQDFYLRRHHA